jgi:hypothetical protein
MFLFFKKKSKKVKNMKYAPKCQEKWQKYCEQQHRVRCLLTSGKIVNIL